MTRKYRLIYCTFIFLALGVFAFYFPQKPNNRKLADHLCHDRNFVLIVYCNDDSNICEKTIQSILRQNYQNYRVICIDDGSNDQTYERIKDFLEHSHSKKRFTLIRHNRTLGAVERLYETVQNCKPDEVVLFFRGNGWLTHCDVLNEFNDLYKHYDVWLAYGQDCDIRTKTLGKTRLVTSQNLFTNSMRRKYWQPPKIKSFYAKLFQKVKLKEFFFRGKFIDEQFDMAYMFPMMEMAKDRIAFIPNPVFTYLEKGLFDPKRPCNRSKRKCQLQISQTTPYSPLNRLEEPDFTPSKVDLIIFSYDRPLQLYALLESIDRYIIGLHKIYILYRSSDKKYTHAFNKIQEEFSNCEWIRQQSSKDFKPLLIDILEKASPYILFGVDDLVVKDYVDFAPILKIYEKVQGYFFSLRLGSHIEYCYMGDFETKVPDHIQITPQLMAWQIDASCGDWTYPNSLDFTIYRKDEFLPILKKINFQHPNSLEIEWNRAYPKQLKKRAIGICFNDSKAVNLPLNQVFISSNRSSEFLTKEELLEKFKKGYKMDIGPLYHMQNPSVHIDYYPTFILRKSHKEMTISHSQEKEDKAKS